MQEQAMHDDDRPARDERGRLLPGHTANRNGRPKHSQDAYNRRTLKALHRFIESPEKMAQMLQECWEADKIRTMGMVLGNRTKEISVDGVGMKVVVMDWTGFVDGDEPLDIDGEVIYPDSRPTPDHEEPLGLLHSVPGEAEVHELHPRVISSYASYNAAGELVGVFTEDSMPAPLSETPQLRSSSGQPAPITRHRRIRRGEPVSEWTDADEIALAAKPRQRIRATTDQRSVEDPLNSSAEAAPGAAAGAFDLENYLDGL